MNYENMKLCQSCGMPMGDTDALYGTEVDGSKSTDYCSYCYDKGAFTFNGTMEGMIEICIPHMVEGNQGMSPEQAKQMMEKFFPLLRRWKTDLT